MGGGESKKLILYSVTCRDAGREWHECASSRVCGADGGGGLRVGVRPAGAHAPEPLPLVQGGGQALEGDEQGPV